jgi:hypothetical protein
LIGKDMLASINYDGQNGLDYFQKGVVDYLDCIKMIVM